MKTLIKRFQNGKFYNTQEHCYVTVENMTNMVLQNQPFQVIDNKSKNDITQKILYSCLLEIQIKKNDLSVVQLTALIQIGLRNSLMVK